MRLITTFTNTRQAKAFSALLLRQGIDNQCEVVKGSTKEDPILCRIWVIDEDLVLQAQQSLEEFIQNTPPESFNTDEPSPNSLHSQKKNPRISSFFSAKSLGKATLLILLACGLIYFATQITSPKREAVPSTLPFVPLFSSPIKKALLYDYPYAYTLIDKIVALYGKSSLQKLSHLPKEGKSLLNQYYQTPYWQGIYDKIIALIQTKKPPALDAPMFEKIRQGQIWRLITPCFLHADIFHLFFNMLWLIMIGKQIEKKLGLPRYLVFILCTGAFSNTAQYLMSGSNFIGFSGVLCAMIVFVWVRQENTPWEGYFMQPATWHFIVFFILLMFGIQIASFAMETAGYLPYSLNIANTAHLSGAFLGYCFGRLKFFNASFG